MVPAKTYLDTNSRVSAEVANCYCSSSKSQTMGRFQCLIISIIAIIAFSAEPKSGLTKEKPTISGIPVIIDADTILIETKRLRLHGIDSPELNQSCLDVKRAKWSCGQRAKDALKMKIAGQVVKCVGNKLDKYRRVIATCYLRDLDINNWLVLNGWAVAYRRYSSDYVASEARAKSEKNGIWSGHFVMPWQWRRGTRLIGQKKQLSERCCKICRNSKACGNSCISFSFECKKPAGCACNRRE